jgi:hypothetical protein
MSATKKIGKGQKPSDVRMAKTHGQTGGNEKMFSHKKVPPGTKARKYPMTSIRMNPTVLTKGAKAAKTAFNRMKKGRKS